MTKWKWTALVPYYYIPRLKFKKVEKRGHCNPKDGLGLKHVSVLWVLASPLVATFMQADHKKLGNLKHMGKMIFLEAIVYNWPCRASNYALAFKSASTLLILRLYIICVLLLLVIIPILQSKILWSRRVKWLRSDEVSQF